MLKEIVVATTYNRALHVKITLDKNLNIRLVERFYCYKNNTLNHL